MNSLKAFKKRIKTSEPLAKHTTFRIGGRARYWFEPEDRLELKKFLVQRAVSLPFYVVGAGSNILVRDGLIPKIFIHLSGGDFNRIRLSKNILSVGAGVRIGRLISFLSSKDIAGYEFLAGIPGTVGGALIMNAGARSVWNDPGSYRAMKDIVQEVEVLDKNAKALRLTAADCRFAYRQSGLRSFIVVGAKLRLTKADKRSTGERIRENLQQRMRAQDWQHPSAGSFFKNPPSGESAGRLIDRCGLKGFCVGDAQVSEKHANFIVNKGKATSRDVIKLMEIIKKKVYNRFQITLEPEVEIVQ